MPDPAPPPNQERTQIAFMECDNPRCGEPRCDGSGVVYHVLNPRTKTGCPGCPSCKPDLFNDSGNHEWFVYEGDPDTAWECPLCHETGRRYPY